MLAGIAVLALAEVLCPKASAQSGLPVMQEEVWFDMPALNGIPSKDDPFLMTDNDLGDCATLGDGHGVDGVSDLDDLTRADDTGDPVGLHNGMVSYRAVDLVIRGRGIDYQLTRRYNSRYSEIPGPMGYGWDHSYNIRLKVYASSLAILWNGNNRADTYPISGSSIFSPKGIYTALSFDSQTNTYLLRARHGSRTRFDIDGRLLSMADRNGNQLTFEYDTSDRLSAVIDTLGRRIEYFYDSNDHLTRVRDFTGREVVYSYDSNGDLVGARTPLVNSTGGFNDYPQGRIERYTYYNPNIANKEVLDHNLKTIVRPNDVTAGSPPFGTPYVEFTYDSGTFLDWCTSQTLGGTNALGPAGGTITYSYTSLGPPYPPLGNPGVARLKTTVTNRRGLDTEYFFNENGHALKFQEYTGGLAGSPAYYETNFSYWPFAGFKQPTLRT